MGFEQNTGVVDQADSPQKIGILMADIERFDAKDMLIDPDTNLPVLVTAQSLGIYNQGVVNEHTGGSAAYVYTHLTSMPSAIEVIKREVNKGSVVFVNTDGSSSDRTADLTSALASQPDVAIEVVPEVVQNQYLGVIQFDDIEGYRKAPGFVEVFDASTEFMPADPNELHPELIGAMDDEMIGDLWDLYHRRFQDVEKISITDASFDRDTFYQMMRDPDIVKAVNRYGDKIAGMMIFTTDLTDATWLNTGFFAEQYPDAYETSNILLFLGAVSDPDVKGPKSFDPIKLLTKVGHQRGSQCIITFECNEVSSHYLPRIVQIGINSSGVAKVAGLGEPVSSSSFRIIRAA